MANKKAAVAPVESEQEEAAQDNIPFEVTDAVDPSEVGDLTDVKPDDTIPATKGVYLQIVKASVDSRFDKEEDGGDDSLLGKSLSIQAKIGPAGIDEEAHYANKNLFIRLPLVLKLDAMKVRHERIQAELVNKGTVKKAKDFNEKWHKDSMYGFREFALATGLAQMVEDETTGQPKWKMTGPIDDNMLGILASGDVWFVCDVARRENTQMDRFENSFSKFRAPEAEGAGE